jgi:hypothetical protein
MPTRTSAQRRTVLLSAVAAAVAALGIAGSAFHGSASTPVAAATVNPAQVYSISTSSQNKLAGIVVQTATPAPLNLSDIPVTSPVSPAGIAALSSPARQTATPGIPSTPLAPQVTYTDLTAQGGQPTIVILPAGYALVDGKPNTPSHYRYIGERLDGQSWTSLPNGTLVTGNADVETDDLPTQAGFTYTYRLCTRLTVEPSGEACSAPTQITTPADMPLPQ